jgi:pimeloyl-ACP methyl ester carboxylesterase
MTNTDTFLSPIEKPRGLLKKLAYAMTRWQFGKVLTPVKVVYACSLRSQQEEVNRTERNGPFDLIRLVWPGNIAMPRIETGWYQAAAALALVLIVSFSTKLVAAEAGRPPAISGYAPVNGLKMYYEVYGDARPDKLPLVLLHGGGSTIETTFAKVLPALAQNRQIIAFEQQGHGRTADIADRPFSFEQSADDTVALLDQLKVEQADLFGFSNGGNIAMRVAIRQPHRVRKLVVASAMFRRDGLYPEVWEFMNRATLENMPPVLQEAYRRVAPHPEQLRVFHDKCATRMREFKDWPADDVRSIAAPTLVMVGDADSVRPEHAVELFRLLPRSKLAVLPGGHGAYIGEATAGRLEDAKLRFGDASAAAKGSRVPELVVAMIEEFLDAPMPDRKVEKSAATPSRPEDWPGLFEQHLNAGDLESVEALYEPEARFVSKSGETGPIPVVSPRIHRPALRGLMFSRKSK